MKPPRLESLLREIVMGGAREPPSAKCLGAKAVFRLVDAPEETPPDDLEHLTTCCRCQQAVALAKRDRDIVDAPWLEDPANIEALEDDMSIADQQDQAAPGSRTIMRPRLQVGLLVFSGIAAVLVVAIGVETWLPTERDPLGAVTGRFVTAGITRDGSRPEVRYSVTAELESTVYLTFLYLDGHQSRQLKLPSDAKNQANQFTAGMHPDIFHVTVTDDPSGTQWIAAIASDQPFNPLSLRDELQNVIDTASETIPFDGLVARLEDDLKGRRGFRCRGFCFDVPPRDAP